ncbi:MAG: class I SAM-dependent methyltransferase [Verrucomicrobiota bacterium]
MGERPTAAAHRVVAEVVRPGDLVVDATAGNGHDTAFLAGLVGEGGRVMAFDVQEEAIRSTADRLEAAGLADRVELRLESHGRLLERVGRGTVSAVMLNLGYLPGGDHERITEVGESCKAVVQGLFSLKEGGMVTVVCYTGHPGGKEEADAVVETLERIEGSQEPPIEVEIMRASRDDAPFLVIVRRCRGDGAN